MIVAGLRECPNCGQRTGRTEDRACQWRGHPIMSESYRKIPKTLELLKREGMAEAPAPQAPAYPEPATDPEMATEPDVGPAGTLLPRWGQARADTAGWTVRRTRIP